MAGYQFHFPFLSDSICAVKRERRFFTFINFRDFIAFPEGGKAYLFTEFSPVYIGIAIGRVMSFG